MRYTEEELRNCLEGRLKWYQEALEYRRKGIMPPIGFPLPDGDINTWDGAARELKNTLDMMKLTILWWNFKRKERLNKVKL